MKYCPMTTNAAPKSIPNPHGCPEFFPHHPATPASQKIAKPPQSKLNGTRAQSVEWKMTEGLGMPAQRMLSPDISSGWSFMEACGSMKGIILALFSWVWSTHIIHYDEN